VNILYHFRTQGTGAEGVHIAGVARAFESLGYRVIFSSPTGVDPRVSAGANPFGDQGRRPSLWRRVAAHAPPLLFELLEIAYNAFAYARNSRLLAQYQCGLIYERHAFFLFATAWLAGQRGAPLVVEVNELAGDERVRSAPILGFLARAVDRTVFRRAKVIVVVSAHLKRRICAMGISPAKILVLPNAVDASLLERPVDREGVRARLGLADAIVVGFVGWFVAWHRLDLLVAQFAAAAEEHPGARLLLVGDGPLRCALAAQAKALGIVERVLFTGAVPHAEIPDYLAATDISVVPQCNAYRSPIKLFEAMAMGCAVLAPAVEPICAVLHTGENGLLFDQERPEDLARQLGALLEDAELREKIGAQARRDVAAKHTWARNAAVVLEGAGFP
jgi:glycosyltransferase involved in cell wall biosynthesis